MRRCLLLLLTACEPGSTPQMMTMIENQAGKYTHTLDGREFIVYVPEQAQGTAAPVVWMFHGTSGDGEKFYNISGWREKADAEGLIAVFPSALINCFHEDENDDGDFDDLDENKLTTKWMAWDWATTTKFEACTDAEIAMLPADKRALADHDYPDDVAFVDAMIDFMKSHYRVDEKRLYASGFSNGAAFSARLALERSQTFAAVASNSGSLQMPFAVAARPVTYSFTVGSIDDRFTVALGLSAIPVQESVLTDVPRLGALVNTSLAMLQLADSYGYSEVLTDGKKTARFVYSTSLAGGSNSFTFSVVQDLGHQYPNGRNHPVVMADVLWSIFPTQILP